MSEEGRLPRPRSLVAAAVIAVAVTAIGIAAKVAIQAWLEVDAGFMAYLPGVAVAAWLRGLWTGLLATILGGLADALFFMPPFLVPLVDSRQAQVRLIVYLFGGALVAYVSHRLRLARAGARLESDERQRAIEAEAAARHQLDLLIESQRRASELREAFNSIVSHELRTPITAIYAGAKLLARRDRPLDEDMRLELAHDLELEAERLYRLVEDLLILARTERGTIELGDEPVLLVHVCDRVVASEQERWPSARFETRAESVVGAARGDDTYIEQVLRNLLGNAAKYSPPDARIEVVVDEIEEGVRVRVLDEGRGVDPEEAGKLFDLYYRSPRTAGAAGGAGIGLFVCRTLVEAMGGRIWAAPRPTGGSEFGFVLPFYEEDGAREREVRTAATE